MNVHTWAAKWGLPLEVVRDLQVTLGLYTPHVPASAESYGKSEAWVQSMVRIEASQKGLKLFRNNVGALKDTTGRVVRYGLANDSQAINEAIKSADLVGFRPLVITQAHVGHMLAQFVSRECKEAGWQYTGTEREVAQTNWANMVNAAGGDAAFASNVGTL